MRHDTVARFIQVKLRSLKIAKISPRRAAAAGAAGRGGGGAGARRRAAGRAGVRRRASPLGLARRPLPRARLAVHININKNETDHVAEGEAT